MEGEGGDQGRGRGRGRADVGIAVLFHIQLLVASQRDQLNWVRQNRQMMVYEGGRLPGLIILAFGAFVLLRIYQKWF